MSNLRYRHTYRRNLPHIQPVGATLFVTFRLAGTLPSHVLQRLIEETEQAKRVIEQISDPVERDAQLYREDRLFFGRYDNLLDQAKYGPTWLKQPEITQIVVDSLHYLDQKKFKLDTYCIMSNHGHVVFTPLSKGDGEVYSLSSIMHSFKRYTARVANLVLGREGQFWQHESYDHFVRDQAELGRIVGYVINNPVKVGLVDDWDAWPWSYSKFL